MKSTLSLRRPLVSLVAGIVLACGAHGQETPQASASPSPSIAEAPATATNAAPPSMLRDPFWPIGWRPPNFDDEASQDKVDGPVQWDRALRLLTITGLSRTTTGDYVAILKGGGIVEPGDVVSVEYESLIYTWQIVNITSDGVFPEQVGVTRKQSRR